MRARPGGRTSRNTEAIHEAVLELLETRGLDFSFQDVANVSGISRRTLHRRWADKNALLTDALDSYYRQLNATVTGNLQRDLQRYLRLFRDFSDSPIELAINGLAAASRDVSFARANAESWQWGTNPLGELLQDAQA